jgi:hypothetical protein
VFQPAYGGIKLAGDALGAAPDREEFAGASGWRLCGFCGKPFCTLSGYIADIQAGKLGPDSATKPLTRDDASNSAWRWHQINARVGPAQASAL